MTITLDRPPPFVPPATLWVPPHAVGDLGDEVCEFSARAGRTLDHEQRIAVEAITAYDAAGLWAAVETLIVEARQNGKTAGVLTPVVLFDLIDDDDPDELYWTAHLFSTTRKAFVDHKRMIEGTPELARRVRRIYEGKGAEAIELRSGAVLFYVARSEGSGRGFGGKRIVIDEALIFTPEQAGALLPSMSARRNPQINYASSAPTSKDESEALRRLVRRGRALDDESLAFAEWKARGGWDKPGCELTGCPHLAGTPGCALDDVDRWLEANHGLRTGRTSVRKLQAFRKALTPTAFGREFLGWGEAGAIGGRIPITDSLWTGKADSESKPVGKVALGVAVQRDSLSAAVALAGWREDGTPTVETVDYRPGDGWLVDRCDELEGALRPVGWALDEKTAAAAHLPALNRVGIRPQKLTTTEAGKACADLLRRLRSEDGATVRHRGPLDPYLTTAALGAQRRDVGPGLWVWAPRTSEVDTVPLEAASWALHRLVAGPDLDVWVSR